MILSNIKPNYDLHQIWFGKQTHASASIDQTGKNSHHRKSLNLQQYQRLINCNLLSL